MILASIFFSYSHMDEGLRDQLEKQLTMLMRQGVITTWHDRRIGAGQDFKKSIDSHINSDDIILLLVSADFIASDYCYDIEMRRAMERHEAGEAIVIPVILRACDWHHAPFGKLNAAPRDGKPITQWPDIDEAFLQVAKAVRDAAQSVRGPEAQQEVAFTLRPQQSVPVTQGPRSSNMRLAKAFTQREKDKFKLEAFEFLARYFENSLAELGRRNSDIEGVFRRIDGNRFFAAIYRDGKDMNRSTIYMGGNFGNGINYVNGETMSSSSMNEALTVNADEQIMFLQAMGMASFGNQRDQKLSYEGAAELFWSLLIGPLQQGR
eukprot:TRINITY_DN84965_c0_g1_i1.p1 TRINITY_DN84965_c0_g1~~TRINITY_DN84965_c0_g1_i1.p1  ORF type:complete len:321 (+),score=13.72 TRINITY_DN84965_c0_g1_i1:78-1040(+)